MRPNHNNPDYNPDKVPAYCAYPVVHTVTSSYTQVTCIA